MGDHTTARRLWLHGVLACVALYASPARADVLLDVAHVVAADPAPTEHSLVVSQAGSYDVTVTDQGFPAALSSLRVAVTQGGTVVNSLAVPGTLTINATPGTYVVRLIGRPDATKLSGTVSGTVTPTGASQPVLLSFADTFALPSINPLQLQVDEPLTIPADGDYTFTLADHAFPAPLSSLSAAVFLGSSLLAVLNPGTPTVLTNLAASVPGAPAQYKVTVLAAAASAPGAGLFGLRVTGGPSSATVYDASTPVGAVAPAQGISVLSGGTAALQVTDFQFPAPLATVGAALTAGGQLAVRELGTGTASGSVAAGTLQLWRVAAAAASAGSYLIAVTEGATTLYSDAEGVSATATNGASAFAFPFTLAASGNYTARVTDFQFPTALPALQFAVVQGGQLLAQAATGGSLGFTAPALGPATLLVIAQPPSSGQGLLGAEVLTTDAAPAHVLDLTQGVGGLFQSDEVIALTSGRYDVTLTDSGWPAPFQNLALALTRGGQVIGKIFGGGTFFVDATPGRYLATFVAVPAPPESAGFYSIHIASSVPTVSLSADQTQIQSGQGVRLTWTTTAASSCTASGAWSGSEPTSGSAVAVGPLTSNSTFTLTCSGPGGDSAPASVTITVIPGSGSGGGGALEVSTLAALLTLFIWRNRPRLAWRRPAL